MSSNYVPYANMSSYVSSSQALLDAMVLSQPLEPALVEELAAAGFDLDTAFELPSTSMTPLTYASSQLKLPTVQMLLRLGASVNLGLPTNGVTALFASCASVDGCTNANTPAAGSVLAHLHTHTHTHRAFAQCGSVARFTFACVTHHSAFVRACHCDPPLQLRALQWCAS